MNATSPWLLNTNIILNNPDLSPVYAGDSQGYSFKIYNTGDSCWVVACWPKGSRIAFRLAYSPGDYLEIKKLLLIISG